MFIECDAFWLTDKQGKFTHMIFPEWTGHSLIRDSYLKYGASLYYQCRSGTFGNVYGSTYCRHCRNYKETIIHLLFYCPDIEDERCKLRRRCIELNVGFHKHNLPMLFTKREIKVPMERFLLRVIG